ncbi:MAG: hypothetical protein NUV77_26785, partial [Thermoguttaceae bacterium]|nr:hypothetical protein [Thermoguttaceae bacterium]
QELRVAVAGRSLGRSAIAILGQTPVKIPAGGTASIRVGVPASTPSGKIDLELSDPPEGIAIKEVSPSREGTAIVLATDAAKVKPGTQGNLIVLASVKRSANPGKNKAKPAARSVPLTALPAIPFEIVAP